LMRGAADARGFAAAPLPWQRGAADARQGEVVRLTGSPEPYTARIRTDGVREGDLVIDLALLGALDIGTEEGKRRFTALARVFVERHGVLRAQRYGEEMADLHRDAALVNRLLGLHVDLQSLGERPTKQALRDLRRRWARGLSAIAPSAAAAREEEFPALLAEVLARLISEGLKGCTLAAELQPAREGRIPNVVYSLRAADLLALAYAQLSLLVTGRVPLSTCRDPACGRWFAVSDPRQKYCTPEHGTRHRVREYARRRRAAAKKAPA
jgi:hypothetical protein